MKLKKDIKNLILLQNHYLLFIPRKKYFIYNCNYIYKIIDNYV